MTVRRRRTVRRGVARTARRAASGRRIMFHRNQGARQNYYLNNPWERPSNYAVANSSHGRRYATGRIGGDRWYAPVSRFTQVTPGTRVVRRIAPTHVSHSFPIGPRRYNGLF